MSINLPLAVRRVTGRADVHITRQLRNLWFRSIANGGFASATIELDRPLNLQPDEIAYYGKVYVYDSRNGKTVWEGRLEDPGRSAAANGTVWELQALGPSAHTQDRDVPLIYVDRNLRDIIRVDNASKPGGTGNIAEDPGGSGNQAVVTQFPTGLSIGTNDRVVMRYPTLWYTGQKLARVSYTWDAGLTDANEQARSIARTDGNTAAGETIATSNWNTAGGTHTGVVVTNWNDGRNTLDLQMNRSAAAAAVPNDTYWQSIHSLAVVAMRYNADGTEKTTGYTVNTVLASDVVADLLGRLLTQFDGAGASIATTSYAIDQLAYPDITNAYKVLADLVQLESGYRWGAWESTATGKYRFEWSPWPTTVRYEASAIGGYSSTGSADGLYNAVRVRYRDAAGQILTVRRTSTVAELTAAGITREASLDLGDELGTAANATQVGDQFLAQHAHAPNAGRLTIDRPILDLITGQMLMPWEIRPGNLIRVHGIIPRIDALNASARDGVTVFKIVATEFRASDGAAELELDSNPLGTSRSLATALIASSDARRR